jgi:tetratricopeptide (TPR) repeat protein
MEMNGHPGTVETLEKELAGAKSRKKRLPIMLRLSHVLRVLDAGRSLDLAEEALEIARALGNHQAAIYAAISVSWHCSNNGGFPRSEAALRIAATHLREVDDPALACQVEHGFGSHYLFAGDLPKAFEHLGRALDMSRDIQGPMTSRILGSMAGAHTKIGSHARALEIFTELLAIWTREGNKQYMAMVMNLMGGIYKDLGEWDRALELFTEALGLVREIGSRMGEATFVGNIGVVHSASGNYETALEYLARAGRSRRSSTAPSPSATPGSGSTRGR